MIISWERNQKGLIRGNSMQDTRIWIIKSSMLDFKDSFCDRELLGTIDRGLVSNAV
jgi:hypothetical protein